MQVAKVPPLLWALPLEGRAPSESENSGLREKKEEMKGTQQAEEVFLQEIPPLALAAQVEAQELAWQGEEATEKELMNLLLPQEQELLLVQVDPQMHLRLAACSSSEAQAVFRRTLLWHSIYG